MVTMCSLFLPNSIISALTWRSSPPPQTQCCGRVPRERDPRPSAGALPCQQHRPHQLLPRQTLQHLAGCCHQAECQRRYGVRVPLQDVWRHDGLFWEDQRGEYQEQLCADLRVAGWWGWFRNTQTISWHCSPSVLSDLPCACVNRITSNQTHPPLNGMLSWQSSAVCGKVRPKPWAGQETSSNSWKNKWLPKWNLETKCLKQFLRR